MIDKKASPQKFFLDTEFHEGFYRPLFGRKRHMIELISIGVVSEDGREYYAISREFDLRAAWNAYDLELPDCMGDEPKKVYWLRENVLRPIWAELYKALPVFYKTFFDYSFDFTIGGLGNLIKMFGKTKQKIAQELIDFVSKTRYCTFEHDFGAGEKVQVTGPAFSHLFGTPPPIFYSYYGSYDWVAVCSLFGRMKDLPDGWPMYTRDLKQMLDDKAAELSAVQIAPIPLPAAIERIKSTVDYPGQDPDAHNALADARWNKRLFDFLQNYTPPTPQFGMLLPKGSLPTPDFFNPLS